MLSDALFKGYAGQIAGLYCKGKPNQTLCKATVKQRIINAFTDTTFENSFLPNLDKNRFYSIEVARIDKTRYTDKVTFKGFDIVTGANVGVFNTTLPKGMWQLKKYDQFFQPHSMRFVGVANNRFIVRRTGVNYGIVFVVQKVDPEPVPGDGVDDLQCPPGFRWKGGLCVRYGITPKPRPVPILPGVIPTAQTPGISFNWEMWTVPLLLAGTIYYLSTMK